MRKTIKNPSLKESIINTLDSCHFERNDRSKFEETLLRFCDVFSEDNEKYARITVSVDTYISPVYLIKEDEDLCSCDVISKFKLSKDDCFYETANTFYFDKRKKIFYKDSPRKCQKLTINLLDYFEDLIIHKFVRMNVEKYFPEHSLNLIDDIYNRDYAYKISLNTILNPENKTLEDIITTRNKYECPKIENNFNLITAMIARESRKELNEELYNELLNYLSTMNIASRVELNLRDMKDITLYYFLYNKIFNDDMFNDFYCETDLIEYNRDRYLREKNYFLFNLTNKHETTDTQQFYDREEPDQIIDEDEELLIDDYDEIDLDVV